MLNLLFIKSSNTIYLRFPLTLDCLATRQNRIVPRYFSAAFELEALGIDFFKQHISKEEFCWVFPHPRLMSKVLNHLADQGARGILLLVCLPSSVAFSRVFAAGKTARFVKACEEVFPTWQGPEEVASCFFKGRARQRVYLIQFDFNLVNPFEMC